MERMWRKVNQGLSSTTSTVFKQSRSGGNSNEFRDIDGNQPPLPQRPSSIHTDDGPVYANVPYYNRGWGYIDTSKCRKRRRKVNPRRNSSKEKNAKTKSGDKSKGSTKETSLRERAVAKLKILNFNINWDVHMKPCGSRVNTSILTRRLCRNRSCDDNELYRSNSFKFERFRREDANDGAVANTLPKQINVCDDYSLPVDFVKKRPSSLEHCRDVRFADDFASPNDLNDAIEILPNVIINPRNIELEPIELINRPLSTASTSVPPEVLRNYCEPKDTKRKSKTKRSRSRDFNYNSDSSRPNSTDDEQCALESKFASSDSGDDDTFSNLNEPEYANQQREPDTSTETKPSPYYYSDLLAKANGQSNGNTEIERQVVHTLASTTPPQLKGKKFQSFLDDPPSDSQQEVKYAAPKKRQTNLQKRHSITERDAAAAVNRFDTFSSTTSDDSNCTECRNRREFQHRQLQSNSCDQSDEQPPSPAPATASTIQLLSTNVLDSCNCCVEYANDLSSMAPHRLLGPAACICAAPGDDEFRSKSIFYVHEQGEDECVDCMNKIDNNYLTSSSQDPLEMAQKRRVQVYETAFDSTGAERCNIDNYEIENRIRNVMLMDANAFLSNANTAENANKNLIGHERDQLNCDYHNNITVNDTNLAQNLENLHLQTDNVDVSGASAVVEPAQTSLLPLQRFQPSPPSTAPLPVKFSDQHDQSRYRIGIRSASDLPLSNALQKQQHRHIETDADKSSDNLNDTTPARKPQKSKPLSMRQLTKKCSHGVALASERVMQLRHGKRRTARPRTKKFSSTESMTSSSGSGSMESLHSSTSEGNRSTTSTESRQSASLSSHSSDSGARVRFPLRTPVIVHANMNILSPISDKSLQEMAAELAEGATGGVIGGNKPLQLTLSQPNATNNDKAVVDDKTKRRYLQNRTSLLLKDEILGSDSGISLQSRDDSKSKHLPLHNFNVQSQQQPPFNNSGLSLPEEFANLPFDMPKLRSRNILAEQKQCTSGSATSVDLGDLPFDMPKLKRRLRAQPGQGNGTIETGVVSLDLPNVSLASSSQSMRDENRSGPFRQNLSLQFNKTTSLKLDPATNNCGLSLNLFGPKNGIGIDAAIPLERQGWYHGALTRIEAESTLRPLLEGSFLVRNCESARNDYSLSLKSAKGFMHMRIQRNSETGKFILGEFSQPFDSVPDIIKHFCMNRLPVRGAEHMCLIEPVIAQLL